MNWRVRASKLVLWTTLLYLLAIFLLGPVHQFFYGRRLLQRGAQVEALKQSLQADLGNKPTKTQVVNWLKKKRIPYDYYAKQKQWPGGVVHGKISLPLWATEDYCAIHLTFNFGKNSLFAMQDIKLVMGGL